MRVVLKWINPPMILCWVIAVLLSSFQCGQAEVASGNEAKVTSPGGYSHLYSKSQNKGSVKVIVQIRAPLTPESLLQERDMHQQRTATVRIQDQVIAELESQGHKPRRVHKYKYAPYIAMTVDSAALDAVLSSPDVISIEEDIPVPPTLDWSLTRIGATQIHASDITGAGVTVAILDTGVDKTHPFLQGSVISEACYSSNDITYGSSSLCPEGAEESTAVGSAIPYGGSCPVPECDHGTHVAGIVAGRSGIVGSPGPGVAPDADIIAIQVFSRFDSDADCGAGQSPCVMSWTSDEMSGLERVYELRNTYSIASVNMSLGGETYTTYCDNVSPAMKAAMDNLRAAKIATVIAGGNDYSCGSISYPACISSAVSVGATDDSDAVAGYSNSASILSLLAPGSSINSSIPLADGGGYQSWSGTSMATPHVAGSWALMRQAFPTATVDEILNAFTSTGLSVTNQGCTSVTKQRINVYEAYNLMSFAIDVTIGTEIVIPGSNFGAEKGKVLIGGVAAKIINWTDTSIACTVRQVPLPAGPYDITIKRQPFKKTSSILSAGTATVKTPELNSLATAHGIPGVEIIITGNFFSTKKGKVYVEDPVNGMKKNCKVTSWGMNSITFVVPKTSKSFPPGTYPLNVMNKVGIAGAPSDFTID